MKKLGEKGIAHLAAILVVVVFAAVAGVGWYVMQKSEKKKITNFDECVAAGNPVAESFPEQCHANGQTFTHDIEEEENSWSDPVASGTGGFVISFPKNWGEITKDVKTDFFIIGGQNQPEGELKFVETEGYGSDSPTVFMAGIFDSIAPPEGKEQNYTLTNGKESPIKGMKYTKVYDKDELVGIGIQRFAGDRDYSYEFPLRGNKKLVIWYSVYGKDPRNNLETVEAIIETIRVK